MKNKGFTMTELMVSIAIISIVMVFLIRLLVDVKYDLSNQLYNTANEINRAEIIKTVQEDMKGKIITSIEDTGSTTTNLIIKIYTTEAGKTGTINVDNNNNFRYTTTGGITKKWSLKKDNDETYIQKTNIKYFVTKGKNVIDDNGNLLYSSDTKDYLITINIPVIIDNSNIRKNNDSNMDNFIFTFYGYENNSIQNNGILNASE